ncbi:MAG: Chromosome partition protein Smc [Chlamydiae bacterium]|nr:Chromosome partition protein Smc [Chlamydiota bacterium]
MIRYYVLAMSCFLSMQLSADTLLSHTAGSFFTPCDLDNIQNSALDEDIIILNDGVQLKGKVPKLPQLQFLFGLFPLNINDAIAIAFSKKDEQTKMQIITHDEYSFVCDIPEEMITLVQYYPSREDATHSVRQEIDPHTINYILFKERGGTSYPDPERLYTLELKNGDQLPIVIKEEKIQLSNGWRDFNLSSNKIVKLTFDNGLYGVLNGEDNKEEELDLSFVKDRYLHIQIAKTPQTLGISWDQIYQIKKNEQTTKKKKSIGAFAWKTSDLGGMSGSVHKSRPETKPTHPKSPSNEWNLEAGGLSRDVPRDTTGRLSFGSVEKGEEPQNKINQLSYALAEEKKYSRELQNQIREMTLDAEAFEKQLTILQDSIFSKDKELEQKLKEAVVKRDKLEHDLTLLKSKLEEKASEREQTELRHSFIAERFTGKLEEALVSLSVQDISINQLRIYLQEEEKKRKEIENELTQAQRSLDESTKETQAISEKYNNAYKQVEILANAHSTTQSENEEQVDQLEKTLDQEKKSVQTLEEKLQQLMGNYEDATRQILTLQNDLEELQEKLKGELSKKEDLQSQLAVLQPKYEEEKESNCQQQAKMQRMNELLNETRQALASKEEQNRFAATRIGSLTKENQSLSQQKRSLQVELQEQKAAFFRQKEFIMKLNTSLHSQKKVLNKIEQSHLNLVAELDKAKNVHSSLIQELSLEDTSPVSPQSNERLPSLYPDNSDLSQYDVHIVSEGENLNNISMKYYGTSYRWSDIYEMNREVIEDVNRLRIGAALVIPD